VAIVIDIADAVVAALNGEDGPKVGQPPAGLSATRAYRPAYDLKDMKDLHVTVVPKGLEMAMAGRGLAQNDAQIDVAVQKKLASADNAEIDALMGLVERIAEFVRSRGRLADAAWVKTENVPIYSLEHMEQLRQFTSVLTFTFRRIG
jgi:hypothetical protein